MGETTNTSSEKVPKKSFFKGLKTEFKKIVWPDQETVGKQTLTVIIISIILGSVIGLLDLVIKWGLGFIL